MAYTKYTIGNTTLDEFVSAIPRIYSKKDENRSVWDVWLHANHHAAAIGEEVRKGGHQIELLEEISHFSMWLFTLLHKLQGEIGTKNYPLESDQEAVIKISSSYSELLWNKYPRMCPVCYWRRTKGNRDLEHKPDFSRNCDCLLFDVEKRDPSQKRDHVRALRSYSKANLDVKPTSVDEWQRSFSAIFRSNLRHLTLESVAFHLLEEVGEVSDAMARMYTYSRDSIRDGEVLDGEPSWSQIWLEEELADVTSWLFALVEKMDFIRETADIYDNWRFDENIISRKPIRLSEIIWRSYGSDNLEEFWCTHCKKPVCECQIIFVGANCALGTLIEKNVDVLN
ncbi:MAG: hypothetical protein IH861_05235 [Chloroflexi bacterium]|nr:hypothetical protein [Chloroflexota bacterium]